MEEYEPEKIECWPENWTTVHIFADMMSQWNVGMSGVIGMRYEALPLVMELHGIVGEQRREVFDGLGVMERAAITKINKR